MKRIIESRKLLDITESTDLAQLKLIYRSLMKQWHPDKFREDDAQLQEAEAKSKSIIEAYHFLVSIAAETIAATLTQYDETINLSNIEDFEYKNEKLNITFSDGATYEYFDVPKSAYSKLVNAPSQARFARRHICKSYVYRSANKLVTA